MSEPIVYGTATRPVTILSMITPGKEYSSRTSHMTMDCLMWPVLKAFFEPHWAAMQTDTLMASVGKKVVVTITIEDSSPE